MADNLKVFTDKVFTGADVVVDTIAITSTNATTKAVIKDVQFGDIDAVSKHGKLTLGNISISNTLSNMSGSQILDNNEALEIKLPGTVDGVKYKVIESTVINSDTQITKNTELLELDTTTTVYKSKQDKVALTSQTYDVPTMSSPIWAYVEDDYIYYCNHQTTGNRVYRASISGGTVGSWVQVIITYYTKAVLDVLSRNIYYKSTTAVGKYDLQTQTSTVFSTLASTSTSVTCSAVLGNYFFCTGSSSTALQVVDLTTQNVNGYTLTGNQGFGALSVSGMGVTKDDTYYYLYFKTGSNVKLFYITIYDLENGIDNFIEGNLTTNACLSTLSHIQGNTLGELVYLSAEGKLVAEKVDKDRQLGVDTYNTLYQEEPLLGGVASFTSTEEGTVNKEDLDISIPCRVSGIEVSEV